MRDDMLVFEIVGEPIYGEPVRIPLDYEWAKGDPPQSTIGGVPVFDINGNPVNWKTHDGMWYSREQLNAFNAVEAASGAA